MHPSRPLLTALLSTGVLAAAAAPASAEKCPPAANYCNPLHEATLRSAKVVGGKGVLTVTARLRIATQVRLTVTRNGKTVGSVVFRGRKGTNVRPIRSLRGKALRRGTYRVRVSTKHDAETMTARVR